jgi:hypothetical protein
MFPGKGVHLVLNEEIHGFLQEALSDIADCYTDEQHDSGPKQVLDSLLATDDGLGWTKEKDAFGTKVFAARPYKKGELRVTVVLTKQDELRLDIREWFEPEEKK